MNHSPTTVRIGAHRRPPSRTVGILLASVVLLGALVVATPATARYGTSNVVRTWNAHTMAALTNPPTASVPGAGQPPPVVALHTAMVHIAVYDAVNSIVGTHEPYVSGLPEAPGWASLDAAVATAAHDVLVGLGRAPVPALPQPVRDWLALRYADTLATVADGDSKTAGVAAGAAAAAAMLAARDGDGRYVPTAFTEGTGAGEWRPTSGVNDPFAWVMNVAPFALNDPAQFPTNGPRPLGSRAYAREYDEVESLGSLTGSSRSPEQQALAEFYTVAPGPTFLPTFRTLTEHKGLGVPEEARFYALVNVAAADAVIACWVEKERWAFWRPITAIRNGDADGNDRTVGDPMWSSFIASPPYPDHVSGYNCYTASLMHGAERFFGHPNADFTVTHPVTGVTRAYDEFRDVYADTIEARILQGIHFRSADEQGARLGRQVANWVARTLFRPT